MNIPHDSAHKHVSGESVYIDDILSNTQSLVGRVVYSKYAHAKFFKIDISKAIAYKGVHAVLTYKDIPGANQLGPVVHDEPCLAKDVVICVGQAICLIAAENNEIAIAAEKLIEIEYEELQAVIDLREAIAKNLLLAPERKMERGNPDEEIQKAQYIIEGELETGAQEHWYLETQACLCVPGEDYEITAYSSTQHPSETQAIIAEVLGVEKNCVVVETRRMGGAFGGKETQANHVAAWSALLANHTKRPVKIKLFRDDDQIITGKRHPFLSNYKVGFNADGKIIALIVNQHANGGCATDLTMAILERAMLHADNTYFIPNIRVIGRAYRTNVASNTAYRGFGGPQGVAVMETIVDRIARTLKKDSTEIRKINFYGVDKDNVTHYGQEVELNRIHSIYDSLIKSSDYFERRKKVNEFNSKNEYKKRGLSATPIKFGISFTTTFLNQAGALVNIYKDGSILVNHGGTEMGQGLNTKIAAIAAAELGVELNSIKVNATNTSKVPNTSATAASAGTDLNGAAVKDAIDQLKPRLRMVAAQELACKEEDVLFEKSVVLNGKDKSKSLSFAKLCELCVLKQVSLSAAGFYKTPDISWDKIKGWGRPFNYFAFGMAVSEVEVDTLTGFVTHLRTDVLHDVGDTINEGLDVGQIEGAYIQGLGWCTTEECKWNAKGHLLNHSPDTYKIPSVQDIPKEFKVELMKGVPNPRAIRKSKAVGEPPFMLAFSSWLAIKDAISATQNHTKEPDFKIPATGETILLSLEKLKKS